MANENADRPLQETSQEAYADVLRDQPTTLRRNESTSSYDSPLRHHHRNPLARRRPVKETLNARSEYYTSQDDGTAEHRINQYMIKQEIGRGSFGAVHLAIDQFGNEYAVKEFSKSRLRKRAQSHLLRRPRGPKRSDVGFNSPLHRNPSGRETDSMGSSLDLIKQEIAVMKKLHHSNLVALIEVLDDPTEDSLYMVMEMCKKGVIMRVSLDERADPYDDEHCRCWFRDMILGIEYLHAQGIVHRDIKPDNCLLTNDDVLKIVDFGVSEIFEKDSDMYTAKSAGSPAFLPPELCVVKHGDVSGKAADIWSMGVTLYCLRYGRLPFEKESIFELYKAIREQPVVCEGEADEDFRDLMLQILEKDPDKRITMESLRVHPWVTKNGQDPLLSEEDNTAQLISPPTEEEVNSAITRNMGHLIVVMKAVRNFKRLLGPAKAEPPMQSILGQDYESHFVQPPMEMEPDEELESIIPSLDKGQGMSTLNKRLGEHAPLRQVERGRQPERSDSTSLSSKRNSVQPTTSVKMARTDSSSVRSAKLRGDSFDDFQTVSSPQPQSPGVPLSRASSATTKRSAEGTRGHARDPLEEEFPYLFIGPSTYSGSIFGETTDSNPDIMSEEPDNISPPETDTDLADDMSALIVSESPGAADEDIYETAYRKEIERILERSQSLREGAGPKVYLTRRVEGRDDVMRLVGKHAAEPPRSKTMPAFGAKLPFFSSPRPTIGGITSQLVQQQQEQQQQKPDPVQETPAQDHHTQPPLSPPLASIPDPATSSLAATGTTSTDTQPSSENSRTKLRSLLGRVRSPRGF